MNIAWRSSLWVLLLVGLALSVDGIASAQTKPSRAKPRPAVAPPPPASRYLTGSFDMGLTTMPPFCMGHQIETVYEALKQEPKGEFETTAEYQARLAAKQPGSDFVYAFIPSGGSRAEPRARYNADAGELTVTMIEEPRVYNGVNAVAGRSILIKAISSSRSHQASNAFGATIRVTETKNMQWVLAIENKIGPPGEIGLTRTVALKLPPSEASILRDQLGAVFVCRLHATQPPYVFEGYHSSGPATFGDPRETSDMYFFVKVDLISVWLFDRASGRVVAKVNASDF